MDLVSTEQIRVIAEVPQERFNFQSDLWVSQPSRDFARGEIFRFEDDEAENEKGFCGCQR